MKMMPIEWSEKFNTGVKVVDDQHHKIIDMFNILLDHKNIKADSATLSEILEELTRYASEHFRAEERLMEIYEYPGIANHKLMHKDFRRQIVQLCESAMLHDNDVLISTLSYIKEWLTNHILIEDMRLKPFLQKK